jgi:hypothetical protein
VCALQFTAEVEMLEKRDFFSADARGKGGREPCGTAADDGDIVEGVHVRYSPLSLYIREKGLIPPFPFLFIFSVKSSEAQSAKYI